MLVSEAAFFKTERAHPDVGDATGAGMRPAGRSGPGHEKARRCRVVIDESTYGIPHTRDTMPFVDQHRWIVESDHGRIGVDHGPFGNRIEPANSGTTLFARRRFAYAFGAVQEDCGELREKRVQLIVDHPTHIVSLESGVDHPTTILFTHLLSY